MFIAYKAKQKNMKLVAWISLQNQIKQELLGLDFPDPFLIGLCAALNCEKRSYLL